MKKIPDDMLEKYGPDKRDKSKIKLLLIKWELAKLLGGKCAKCGETDLRVLCFHHKLGGMGSDKWRRMSRKQRYDHIHGIIEAGRPEDVDVLCMNCHTKDFSRPKLYDRFSDFLRDFQQRVMKIGKRVPRPSVTELPNGLMVLD